MTTENRIKLKNNSTTLADCGGWLKVCEDNYDDLVKQALPRRSEEFYGNQPTWSMDEPPSDY